MRLENSGDNLLKILTDHVEVGALHWLEEKIKIVVDNQATRQLYLTYSLIPSKIDSVEELQLSITSSDLHAYLIAQKATIHEVARIYLLHKVLKADVHFFTPKIAKLIEVADKVELETFLKFLILLPNAEAYKNTAVEALRSNIVTVFNAIAHHNPYPSLFFDDKQWNQMYLKAAFMQGDLSAIVAIDKRANKDLARIISDYAHERWAAGRTIDPNFWRPVAKFIGTALLADMQRLLCSENEIENRAAALCCYASDNIKAKNLLIKYSHLVQQIEKKGLSWSTLKTV